MLKKLSFVLALLIMLTVCFGSIVSFADEESSEESIEESSEESVEESAESSVEESIEESSEEASEEISEEISEEQSEEPSIDPDARFTLTFSDKEYVTIDVPKGFVGYSYNDGVSVYTYTYGTKVEISFSVEKTFYMESVLLNGEETEISAYKLSLVMDKDYVLEPVVLQAPMCQIYVEFLFGGMTEGFEFLYEGNKIDSYVEAYAGSDVTFVLSAPEDAKYDIIEWSFIVMDGTDDSYIEKADEKTVVLHNASYGVVHITVKGQSVPITIDETENGTITVDNKCPAENEEVVITFTPDEGYVLKSATLNGMEITPVNNQYTAVAVGSMEISAVFGLAASDVPVTITVINGEDGLPHGIITFDDTMELTKTVLQGTTVNINFTPDELYEIDTVTINGIGTTVSSENMLSVIANEELEITVSYKKLQYRITAVVTVNGGGKITAEGYTIEKNMVYVDCGDTIVFKFTPDMYYALYTVKVDTKTIYNSAKPDATFDGTYTFENVTSNHTIAVTFQKEGTVVTEYSINATAGEHGTISPDGIQKVVQGESAVYTITPDAGYEVDYVTVDGNDVSLKDGTYTFDTITASHVISAYFKAKKSTETGVVNVEDIDWTQINITIDLSETTKVGKAVFEKLANECAGRNVIFKSSDYEISFVVSSLTVPEDTVDLAMAKGSNCSDYQAICSVIQNNSKYADSIFAVYQLNSIFPKNATAKVYLSRDFAGKETAYCVKLNASEISPVATSVLADEYGYVTVTLQESKELIFLTSKSVAVTYNVSFVCGENGKIDQSGNIVVDENGIVTLTCTPDEGYQVSKVLVNGISENLKDNNKYEFEITSDTVIEVRFALAQEESSNAGLIVSIIIIVIALAGGAVLFIIKWKQMKY